MNYISVKLLLKNKQRHKDNQSQRDEEKGEVSSGWDV